MIYEGRGDLCTTGDRLAESGTIQRTPGRRALLNWPVFLNAGFRRRGMLDLAQG